MHVAEFSIFKLDCYYVGDITYIAIQEGWLYLAIVIDFYSRQVFVRPMDERKRVYSDRRQRVKSLK